ALGAHRVDQCLVAVAQIDRAPARGVFDDLVRPGAVGQLSSDLFFKRRVPAERHVRGLLQLAHKTSLDSWRKNVLGAEVGRLPRSAGYSAAGIRPEVCPQ